MHCTSKKAHFFIVFAIGQICKHSEKLFSDSIKQKKLLFTEMSILLMLKCITVLFSESFLCYPFHETVSMLIDLQSDKKQVFSEPKTPMVTLILVLGT